MMRHPTQARSTVDQKRITFAIEPAFPADDATARVGVEAIRIRPVTVQVALRRFPAKADKSQRPTSTNNDEQRLR